MKNSKRALAALLVLGLTAAACSDDKKDATETTVESTETTTADTGGTETTVAADPLGTPNAATGDAVKVGYITDGQSAAIDNTGERQVAEGTFKYVNEYLGGLGGHVIEPVICETKQDPALAADCATQMVNDGVVAVLWDVSGQAAAIAGPIQAAGIPMFVFATAETTINSATTSFVLANGLSSFVFPAGIAKEKGYTKAAWIVIDVPGATGPAAALGAPIMANAGVAEVDLVNIAPGTADMGPQIQAALAKGPELVHMIGNASFCATAMQALIDAEYEGTVTMISNCIDETTIEAIGAGLKGVLVSYAATEDPTDPDYQLFLAIIDAYGGDKIEKTGSEVGAFSVVASFGRLMAGLTGDVTIESVLERARTAEPLPLAAAAGATFQCNGKAISIIPAACSSGLVAGELGEDGKPTSFSAVEISADLLKLG